MVLPSWLSSGSPDDCDHDFSVSHGLDDSERPSFVHGPVRDLYCAKCGEKASLRHRMALAASAPAVAPPAEPVPLLVKARTLPDPVPESDIVVYLDVERFGKRYDRDRAKGIKDRAVNVGSDPRWNDAMAAAAEQYVALALGVPFTGDSEAPDKGWDMAFAGRRVQAKWTRYAGGQLIASPKQTNNADYYVLVTGATVEEFRIAGWATLKELKASLTDLGYGPTFCVAQDNLRPFDALLAIRLDAVQSPSLTL